MLACLELVCTVLVKHAFVHILYVCIMASHQLGRLNVGEVLLCCFAPASHL